MNIEQITRFLLANDILRFGEFRLVSGRISPYYFNLRNLSDCEVISRIGDFYAEKVEQEIGIDSFDVLFGVAYAGILISFATAESVWRNFGVKKRIAYNRKELKMHGDPRNELIAGGQLKDEDSVLIVDDVLTTGETKLEIKKQLEIFPNLKFRGLLVFLDRCEVDEAGDDARKILEEKGLPVFSVISIREAVGDLSRVISKEAVEKLQKYLEVYGRK